MHLLKLCKPSGSRLNDKDLRVNCISGGWFSNGWYQDSIRLAEKVAMEKATKVFTDRESEIAVIVTNKLKGLKANERIIERHTKDVVERPVYRNICIDDDGLRILNGYASGDSGGVADKVR